jgi:hypothetical protein
MGWVTWRQHRAMLAGVSVFLGGLAAWLGIAGLRLHDAYTAALTCRPSGSVACAEALGHFNGMNRLLANGSVFQIVPPLVGAFLGAPLLARELENGTFRYAWTQGFGRWRWTLAKLVLLGVAVTAAAACFTVLLSWYYRPYLASGNQSFSLAESSAFSPGLFDLRGVAFAAWTLLAFAIGASAGLLIARVVPAIAATLAAYAGLAVAAALYLREHYLTPLVTTSLNVPGSAWILSQEWLGTNRQPVSASVLGRVLLKGGPLLAGKGGVPQAIGSWQYLSRHGYTLQTTYQPAARFWPFQWIEGGWLLALSVILIALTVWLVCRRTA